MSQHPPLNFLLKFILKINIYQILLIILLYASFVLRIETFKSPHYHYQGDYNRDYLIANHIIKYKELPLRGPYGELGPASESPIYYYLLATFLFVKNDIIFLGFINVVLQMVTLIIIYLLSKEMFSRATSLITVLFFGFSQGIISQSSFVWQPHIMQPFINLAYLLLLLSYKRKSYTLLLGSIFTLFLSITLYYPALAIAPAFLFLATLILAHQKKGYQFYLGALIAALASFIVLYLPLIFYLFKKFPQLVTRVIEMPRESFIGMPQNLINRTEIFLSFFFVNSKSIALFPISTFVFLVSTLCYFFFLRKSLSKKYYLVIVLCSILSFLIIVSLKTGPPLIEFPIRHFTPIFGLFIIYISEIINIVFSKNLLLRITKGLIILLLLTQFTKVPIQPSIILQNPLNLFNLEYIENPAVLAIKQEIFEIQKKEQKKGLDFFQFISYRNSFEDRFVNEIFWRPLEKQLNQKLTEVNDDNFYGYEPTTSKEYLFLRCQFQHDENRECLNPFLKDYPKYLVVKKILHQNPSVYLTRLKEL